MPTPQKRWQLYPQHPELSQKIGTALNLHPATAQLLINRSINSLKDAKEYLNPEVLAQQQFPDEIFDPMAALILQAIEKKSKILVYGDYDVDGMTSTTMMMLILKQCGANIEYFIPNRFREGYGLSTSIIPKLQSEAFDLLLTLDCGITNVKEVTQIVNETQAAVGIFDHHNIPKKTPPAKAIINPKSLPEDSPLHTLCTAGIVYLFLLGFCQKYFKEVPVTDMIDLAGIGTVADVAALKGLNRYLVQAGLKRLNQKPQLGIKKLLEAANFDKPAVTVRDIGFVIAPRLNAAGRIYDAKLSVDLLLNQDPKDALNLAHKLEKMNLERREIGDQMMKESYSVLEDPIHPNTDKVIALEGKGWHAGVIGIAASRLVDKYAKPTVLIATDDQIGRGSARSVGDVDIYSMLKQCDRFFEKFGGHKAAAGFSILPEKIDPFKKQLKAICNAQLDPKALMPIIQIDRSLSPAEISMDLLEEISMLEPFGEQNREPIFYCKGLKPLEFRPVGDGSHLKATFTNQDETFFIDGIGFGLSDRIEVLYKHEVELVFHLSLNEWQGKKSLQLSLLDLK